MKKKIMRQFVRWRRIVSSDAGRIRPVVIAFILIIAGLVFHQWWWKVGGIILIIVFVDAVLHSPRMD